MIQKQFAPAGGASFNPAMPQYTSVEPQQQVDLLTPAIGLAKAVPKMMQGAFQQGELDQMAGAYEEGKYWWLGDAYQNGAKYAIAQNDLLRTKVQISQIVNDGLASGQDATTVMQKVQQKTASLVGMADDFKGLYPEASNYLKQQVKGMQAQSVAAFAVGEHQRFIRNSQTADQLMVANSVDSAVQSLQAINDGQKTMIDPNAMMTALQQPYQILHQNAIRYGIQNPAQYASNAIVGAITAKLSLAQTNDPQAIATINALPQVSKQMFEKGWLSAQGYNRLMNFSVQKIGAAQQLVLGQIDMILASGDDSTQAVQKVNQLVKVAADSGVSKVQLARRVKQFQTNINSTATMNAMIAGTIPVTPDKNSKVDNALKARFGANTAEYVKQAAKLGQHNEYFAQRAGAQVNDYLTSVFSTSTEKAEPHNAEFLAFIMQQYDRANADAKIAPFIRRKLSTQADQFFMLNHKTISAQLANKTYNHKVWVNTYQQWLRDRRGAFNPEKGAITADNFNGFGIGSSFRTGLNTPVASTLAQKIDEKKSTIAGSLASMGKTVADPEYFVPTLQANDMLAQTDNGYTVFSDMPISKFFQGKDRSIVMESLQNAMKYKFRLGGSVYQTSQDQIFTMLDSSTGTISLWREDADGIMQSYTLSNQQFLAEYGRVQNQRDKITGGKLIGAVAGLYQKAYEDTEYREPAPTGFQQKPLQETIPDYNIKTLDFGDGQPLPEGSATIQFYVGGQKRTASVNDVLFMKQYMASRLNGTYDGVNAYASIESPEERGMIKKFLGSDPIMFFPQDPKNQQLLGRFFDASQQARRLKVNDNMKVLEEVKAYGGKGTTNTYYVTDTLLKSALGPNLAPKVAVNLAKMQGFILEYTKTNPAASNKAVIGTGYDGGYPAFNAMFKEAKGDPVKLSEATNRVYLWWFDQVPNQFQKATGLDFMKFRDDARFQNTFIAACDFLWHSGKGNRSYFYCLELMTKGMYEQAYSALLSTEAYRESQAVRKDLLMQGLKDYEAYLKDND